MRTFELPPVVGRAKLRADSQQEGRKRLGWPGTPIDVTVGVIQLVARLPDEALSLSNFT